MGIYLCHFITKTTNNKCWQGCGAKGTLAHCWWECKLMQSLWKTIWRFLKKLKIETSLAVQWLRLHTSIAGGMGSIPAWKLRSLMPHDTMKKKREREIILYILSLLILTKRRAPLIPRRTPARLHGHRKGFERPQAAQGFRGLHHLPRPALHLRVCESLRTKEGGLGRDGMGSAARALPARPSRSGPGPGALGGVEKEGEDCLLPHRHMQSSGPF